MATASLNLSCTDHRDNGLIRGGVPPQKTGLDDKALEVNGLVESSTWRCDSVCMNQNLVRDFSPQLSSWSHLAILDEICEYVRSIELPNLAQDAPYLVIDPPPTYTAAVKDTPPCYQLLQVPITRPEPSTEVSEAWQVKDDQRIPRLTGLQTPTSPIFLMKPAAIDFGDTSTFRQAGKKAAKKTQQKASQDKWADNAGEGANEGGNDNAGGGGDGGGGGAGGGSNNGDGGAGDDGGGDDGGGDEWNFGGGKKKKKGKKNKNALDEEEEEKEKEEEEKKKKKEANGMSGAQDLSWMDDAVGKPDDEWGAFTTTDKKGKKNKKGKTEAAIEQTKHNAFEDINLDGDTPKLDLNFEPDVGTKGSGGGFDFGASNWGSSWDTGTKWDFDGMGKGATDITDSHKDTSGAADDLGSWGIGKKSKKTTATSGFGFGDFAALDEGGEAQANTGGDQDDWATGFTATGKKSKKNKKNVIEDSSNATDTTAIGTA
ncbi:MAG: hypothetical protein Q9170_006472, partial [Blastenia crenularia]